MNSTVKDEPSTSSSRPHELFYDVLENGVEMETFEFDDSAEAEILEERDEFLPPPQRTGRGVSRSLVSSVCPGEPCRGRVAMCNGYQMRSVYANKKGIHWECRHTRTSSLRCYGSAQSDMDGRNLEEQHAHNHPAVPFNYREPSRSCEKRPEFSRSSIDIVEPQAPIRHTTSDETFDLRRERTTLITNSDSPQRVPTGGGSSMSLAERLASIVDKRYDALATTSTAVEFLMQYNKSSEVEFSRKAITSLVRKLNDKPLELAGLVDVVGSGGRYPGTCVTIDRTTDGRLQIAERKVSPHAVYAQIFRWPDVRKAELRSISLCNGGFDAECAAVCVNPYHYERVPSGSPTTIRRLLNRIGADESALDIIVLDD